MAARRRDTVCISGLTGDGLEPLMDLISAKLAQSMVEVCVCGWGCEYVRACVSNCGCKVR